MMKIGPKLKIGDAAPALELPTREGAHVRLVDFRGRPVLVSFLSHAAWPFGRTHLVQVIEQKEVIEKTGAQVLLVTHAEPTLLEKKMMHDLQNPFPLLLDPEMKSFHAWGLGKARPTDAMFSPSLNWRYLKLLLRGERFLGVAPNMFQLGGDFIVDPAGRIAAAHPMRNNGDHRKVAQLLEELQQCVAAAR